jgi:hypothetical protein
MLSTQCRSSSSIFYNSPFRRPLLTKHFICLNVAELRLPKHQPREPQRPVVPWCIEVLCTNIQLPTLHGCLFCFYQQDLFYSGRQAYFVFRFEAISTSSRFVPLL